MKILYFAWVKEHIGQAEEEVILSPKVTDVAKLIQYLCTRTQGHAMAFADLSMIQAAVNHEHVGFEHPIKPTDEVAFFPPITGG